MRLVRRRRLRLFSSPARRPRRRAAALDLLRRGRAGRARGRGSATCSPRRRAPRKARGGFRDIICAGAAWRSADAQCPRPEDDKTAAVNAQFTAAEFNRKLGRALREVAASEFPPRR